MLKFALLACLLRIALTDEHPPFEVIFQWNFIPYAWPSESDLAVVEKNKEYIAANNSIAGIKVWKDKMFLTIPRWRSGVPVTLAVYSIQNLTNPDFNGTNQALSPYPNWDMQTLNDCSAFQSVQSMEIDPLGRMWVLDTGRTETLNVKPSPRCPPRLVILDIEQEGAVLRSYAFPETVAPKNSSYLNDIVLDHDDGGMAYISDSGDVDPGIIVFSLRDTKSWKIRHESMKSQNEATKLTVNGTTVRIPTNVDGIALSPPGPDRQLYYSPLSAFHMYSISVSILKNSSLNLIDDYDVCDLGRTRTQTSGTVMTNQGQLYLGLLVNDAIGLWDSKNNPTIDANVKIVSGNDSIPPWLDSFGIDDEGRTWCVTNNYQNFFTDHVNMSVFNYRVLSSQTTARNYQYFENGTAPELPIIIATADRNSLALFSWLAIALVFFAR